MYVLRWTPPVIHPSRGTHLFFREYPLDNTMFFEDAKVFTSRPSKRKITRLLSNKNPRLMSEGLGYGWELVTYKEAEEECNLRKMLNEVE